MPSFKATYRGKTITRFNKMFGKIVKMYNSHSHMRLLTIAVSGAKL